MTGRRVPDSLPPSLTERRISYTSLLNKPTTVAGAGLAVALSDIPPNAAATRKFLESASSAAPVWTTVALADIPSNAVATRKFLESDSAVAPAWATLTAADIGAGTFPTGTFAFPNAVTVAGIFATGGATQTGAAAGDVVLPNAKAVRGANAAGTAAVALLMLDGLDRCSLNLNSKAFALPGAVTLGTVGAAGGGSALPAFPVSYLQVVINGTAYSIPFYNP